MAHYVGIGDTCGKKQNDWIVRMTHYDAFCISLNWWKITEMAYGA